MTKIKIKTGNQIWEAIELADAQDNEQLLNDLNNLEFIAVKNLVKVLEEKIERCTKEITIHEDELRNVTPEREMLVKAKIAILDVGANSYRAVIGLLTPDSLHSKR